MDELSTAKIAMTIEFYIDGNQMSRKGNPIPYVRSTRGALWRKDGKRYAGWKDYVRTAYALQVSSERRRALAGPEAKKLSEASAKPINLGEQKAVMDIKILWASEAHGDPDNIWKGIADALFVNDKNLDGSFESCVADNKKGRVHVRIEVEV